MLEKKLPKIAIVGYGAMGKEIENIAQTEGIVITDIFDVDNMLSKDGDYDFDVAIDFSLPEAVIGNIEILTKLKKNIVVGTTGWQDQKEYVQSLVTGSKIGFLWGSNFSIGMQMLFRITDYAAKLMNAVDGYDIMIHEMHHTRKKDSPSGTAITLAEKILNQVDGKTEIETDAVHGTIHPNMLHVSSTRGGAITGLHTVYIDSNADSIELTHRAKNRSGFAQGAISAAKWLVDKNGFFEFEEMLEEVWV